MGGGAHRELDALAAFCLWNSGHLLENRTRGAYAEWLVHRALGIDPGEFRREWEPIDLRDRNLTLEIQSAAYVQSWQQREPSRISFATEQRAASAYVFCLLDEPDPDLADPQDLSQWRFWVVPTRALHPERKSIGLQALIRSFGDGISHRELPAAVETLRPIPPATGAGSEGLS